MEFGHLFSQSPSQTLAGVVSLPGPQPMSASSLERPTPRTELCLHGPIYRLQNYFRIIGDKCNSGLSLFENLTELLKIILLKLGHTPFELLACLAHGQRVSVLLCPVLVRTGEFVQASSEKLGEPLRNCIN